MELYKIGKVISLGKTYIILECNYSGKIVYVARPNDFEKDKLRKVYTYIHKTEYTENIYGFATFKERVLFENLISISGIGPKTAINILRDGVDKPIELIQNGDAKGLTQFPTLGIKTANQIIFELKEKYANEKVKADGLVNVSEIKNSLKTLGFKSQQIDFAISKLRPEKNIETLVEKAIVLISNANFA